MSKAVPSTLFGRRLRAARERAALPQDRLGVLIGLDEGCSSARISRYETGTHEPPFAIAASLAKVLKIPVAYLYCLEDDLADLILDIGRLTRSKRIVAAKTIQRIAQMDNSVGL